MTYDNITIIKKVSSILNIHKERITIKTCERKHLTDYSFPPGEYIFINDKDNETLTRIHSLVDIDNILNKPNLKILIIRDNIYSNIEDQKKKMNEIKLKEK